MVPKRARKVAAHDGEAGGKIRQGLGIGWT